MLKRLLCCLTAITLIMAIAVPFSAIAKEEAATVNVTGATTAYQGAVVTLNVSAALNAGNNIQGVQIDFKYSSNFPEIDNSGSIITENTTGWDNGSVSIGKNNLLGYGVICNNDAVLKGNVVFNIPEDAPIGTEYTFSFDYIEVSSNEGILPIEKENESITITVIDLPEIEGTSVTGYEGIFDGQNHTISAVVPQGAEVKYGTVLGVYELDNAPEFKDANEYNVYYKFSKNGYKNKYGNVTVKINPKELTDSMVEDITAQQYTGDQIRPIIAVTDGTPSIITENDYDISYGENINVADGGTAVLTGKGNYSGSVTKNFEITPAAMTVSTVNYNGIYDGQNHKSEVNITSPLTYDIKYGTENGTYNLTEMPEYKDAGTYRVYYKATALNYTDCTGSVIVKITPKEISNDMIEEIEAKSYTGEAICPSITVTDNGIISEDDYDVEYGENINVATGGSVKIIGKKNYKGIATKTFEILPIDMDITSVGYDNVFDGQSHTGSLDIVSPTNPVITYGTTESECSETSIPTYKNAGTYTVYYKAVAPNYNDKTGSFTVNISKKQLQDEMLETITAQEFNGTQIKPNISVIDGLPSIITESDYDIIYGENINVETGGSVKIIGKGNYEGEVEKHFDIVPAVVKVRREDYNGTFDGQNHKATLTVTEPQDATVKFGMTEGTYDINEMPEFSNAGGYTVYYEVTAENYTSCIGNVKVIIAPKELSQGMVLNVSDAVYTGIQITPSVIVEDSSLITEDDYTISYGQNKTVVENGTVTVTGKNNYCGEIVKNFNINKASLLISAADKTITYGETPEIAISYDGFVNSETSDVLLNNVEVSGFSQKPNAGSYPVKLGGAVSDNYEISYATGATLTVEKKSITLNNLSVFDKAYDGTTEAVINTSAITFEGLIDGESIITDTSSATAEFASSDVADNVAVAVTGINISGNDAKNYVLSQTDFNSVANIKDSLTASYIAQQITSLTVERYAKNLVLPEIPTGYVLSIKSSDNEEVINLNGAINASDIDNNVTLVLTVSNEDGTDVADTSNILVTVPAMEKVNISVSGSGNGTVSGSGEYFRYSNVRITAAPNNGYDFAGWYNGDEQISVQPIYTFNAEENMNLFAKFNVHVSSGGGGGPSTYLTVKFDSNGGSKINSLMAVRNSTLKTIPTPTKDGYVFDGWYLDKSFTNIFDSDKKLSSSVTLYAKWSETQKEDITKKQIILKINSSDVVVFGETKKNDVAPIIVNNFTMLPVRFIAEALGATVEWSESEQKVTITNGEKVICLYINSEKGYVNNELVILDSPAFIENDRTFIPIRFVSENLGAKVEWNEADQEVTITKY